MFGSVAWAENEATYNSATGIVNIPKVSVGSDYYQVEMTQQGQGLEFGVTSVTPSTSSSLLNIATYNPSIGTVYIPKVVVGSDSYTVNMQQQGQDLEFSVTDAEPSTSSSSYSGAYSGAEVIAYSGDGEDYTAAATPNIIPVVFWDGMVGSGPPEDFTPAAPSRPSRLP